jgi:hypothetical protein
LPAQAFAVKMGVPICHAGNDAAPGQVNQPGIRAHSAQNLGVAAGRQNLLTTNRYGLHAAQLFIPRMDAAPVKNQAGR